MERISASEAGDGGSNPPWGTTFVLCAGLWIRRPKVRFLLEAPKKVVNLHP